VQNETNHNYSGDELLSEIDSNLFNYSQHIVNLIINSMGVENLKKYSVLDFGAGQGTLAEILRNQTGNVPVCVELDTNLISILKTKNLPAYRFLSEIDGKFELIYTSNVLEHIEFDLEALRGISKKMSDSGRLAIYVPAFPILFSKLDQQVGHFRRYKKKELVGKLETAGFKVISKEYSDSVGFIATLFLKFFRFSFALEAKTSNLMKFYDWAVVPISIFLDRLGFKYIFGKNLFVVAELRN
jgi:2-polyprenyl-3-methyl-5-hydroxy-6-metoxy-1,4-benzoquinol methylase